MKSDNEFFLEFCNSRINWPISANYVLSSSLWATKYFKKIFSDIFMKVANPRLLWFKETIVFWKTVRLDQVLNDRVWVIKIHTFYVLLFIFEISVPFILGRYTKMKGTFILMMRIFSNLAIMLKTWVREIFPISSQNFSTFSVIFFVKVWTYTLVVIDLGSDSNRWVFLNTWFSLN